jgi:hypothetical protein
MGAHGALKSRNRYVQNLLTINGIDLHSLGVTAEGHPRHPLYIKGDTKPFIDKKHIRLCSNIRWTGVYDEMTNDYYNCMITLFGGIFLCRLLIYMLY